MHVSRLASSSAPSAVEREERREGTIYTQCIILLALVLVLLLGVAYISLF